jgi:vacuolar iron transporter family protein
MPQPPHIEKHFTASETVRDIVIDMSDRLTVPFALAVRSIPWTCRRSGN